MLTVYGGSGNMEDSDYDEKLRIFFKKINENVDDKDKIKEEDIEHFIKDKDTITKKLSELAIEKPEVQVILNNFIHSQDENLNNDLPPTMETPITETAPIQNENMSDVSKEDSNENNFKNTDDEKINNEKTDTNYIPELSNNKYISSNEENKNNLVLNKPFGNLNRFAANTSSFANKALDVSSKASEMALKMQEISTSKNPLEAIDTAESNGSIDSETANKLKKTYQGIQIAKNMYTQKKQK
jgi:hypothetical protein